MRQQLHETNTKLLRLEVAYNKQETEYPLEIQKLSSKASRCDTMLAAANDEVKLVVSVTAEFLSLVLIILIHLD